MSKFSKIFSGNKNIGKQHKLVFQGKSLHSGQLVLEKNLEKSGFPVY
jgi:hypothetical protein